MFQRQDQIFLQRDLQQEEQIQQQAQQQAQDVDPPAVPLFGAAGGVGGDPYVNFGPRNVIPNYLRYVINADTDIENTIAAIINTCPLETKCLLDHSANLGPFTSKSEKMSSAFPGLCKEHVCQILGLDEIDSDPNTPWMNPNVDCNRKSHRRFLIARKLPSRTNNVAFETNDIIIPYINNDPNDYEIGMVYRIKDPNNPPEGYKFSKQLANFFKMAFNDPRKVIDICDPFKFSEDRCDYTKVLCSCLVYIICCYHYNAMRGLDRREILFLGGTAAIIISKMIRDQNVMFQMVVNQYPNLRGLLQEPGMTLLIRLMELNSDSIRSRIAPNVAFGPRGLYAIRNICDGEPLSLEANIPYEAQGFIIFTPPSGNSNTVVKPPTRQGDRYSKESRSFDTKMAVNDADGTMEDTLKNCSIKIGSFTF